ncbi:hypothetical protein EBT31_06055 [bacterium]|nr:hypothetical protein [bacterium]
MKILLQFDGQTLAGVLQGADFPFDVPIDAESAVLALAEHILETREARAQGGPAYRQPDGHSPAHEAQLPFQDAQGPVLDAPLPFFNTGPGVHEEPVQATQQPVLTREQREAVLKRNPIIQNLGIRPWSVDPNGAQ